MARNILQQVAEALRKTSKAPILGGRTYEVQAGDTLSGIAKKVYNDGSRWREIYNANKDKIEDPDVIKVGQKLTIPR